MNNVRSCLPSAFAAAAFAALSAQTALAQVPPAATIVRTVLAVTSLPSVVDAPVFFKLSKIELAAGQATKYSGPVGFLYVLSAEGCTRYRCLWMSHTERRRRAAPSGLAAKVSHFERR